MVIVCPNSHEKLTKRELGQVQVGSNIAQNHIFAPIHIKSLSKSKLGQVGIGLNIAQNGSNFV